MKIMIGSITTKHTCSECKAEKSVSFLGKRIFLEDLGALVAYYSTCNACGGQLNLKAADFKYTNSGVAQSGF